MFHNLQNLKEDFGMKPAEKFLAINTDEIEWQDGEKVLGLPPGLKVKIIAEGNDAVSERVD